MVTMVTIISIFLITSIILPLPLFWEGALLRAARRLGWRVLYTTLPPGVWGSFDSPEYTPPGAKVDPHLILISYSLPFYLRFIPLLRLLIHHLIPSASKAEVFLAFVFTLFPACLILFPPALLFRAGWVALRIWRAILLHPLPI